MRANLRKGVDGKDKRKKKGYRQFIRTTTKIALRTTTSNKDYCLAGLN